MKAAKIRQADEEKLNEKIMIERLRVLGIQNGRAVSVPLAFHVRTTILILFIFSCDKLRFN